jgi:SSS family solute:Na+ symporter
MNLTGIDWLIVIGFVLGLASVALYTRRYTNSVSDFLSANRCAGRYLLTMSEGMAALGAAAVVANFEKFFNAGFAASWWGFMLLPVGLIAAISGWVLYRYRETRAMTMAEFFEMRYSRNFRIYTGILGWLSGIINYGIFPSVLAYFLIYFCGFPQHFSVMGIAIWTFPLVMLVMMTIAVWFTLCGGMVAVMVTDFLQAQFTNIAFMLILVILLLHFSWADIIDTLKEAPHGQSMIDPFDQAGVKDFNVVFFMIFAFKAFYNRLGWQGIQGYNCSARTPHEAKMASVLAEWRNGVTYLLLLLMPICAYVMMHGHGHEQQAAMINEQLANITDEQARHQMVVPLALGQVLPVGVVGMFVAAMIAAAISTDDSNLHSWGSIFIQDVILPFRNKPLSEKQHLRLLQRSIIGVAVFAFFFSLFFPLHDYLFMFFLVTGTIYLGGSGAVIIGGLYWKRATVQGAWAAMTNGWIIAITGISIQVFWPQSFTWLQARVPAWVPVNGVGVALLSYLTSIAWYVGVSLLTCKEPFNLDQMLHRGAYAVPGDHPEGITIPATGWRALGTTAEFTRGDKIIYYAKLTWTGFWFVAFVSGTIWALIFGIDVDTWAHWWWFTVMLGLTVGSITVVWFLWGGTRDLLRLFKDLNTSYAMRTRAAQALAEIKSTSLDPTGEPLTECEVTVVP